MGIFKKPSDSFHPTYAFITLQKLVSAVCTFCLSPLILEKVLP